MHLTIGALYFAFCAIVQAAPAPSPESVGAGGECFDPVITVSSVEKVKQGPYLVTGARADANPGGGKQNDSKQVENKANTIRYGLILKGIYCLNDIHWNSGSGLVRVSQPQDVHPQPPSQPRSKHHEITQ